MTKRRATNLTLLPQKKRLKTAHSPVMESWRQRQEKALIPGRAEHLARVVLGQYKADPAIALIEIVSGLAYETDQEHREMIAHIICREAFINSEGFERALADFVDRAYDEVTEQEGGEQS